MKVNIRYIFNIGLYGRTLCYKLPVNDFKWGKDIADLNEDHEKP